MKESIQAVKEEGTQKRQRNIKLDEVQRRRTWAQIEEARNI